MAFAASGVRVLGHSPNRLLIYDTADAIATVIAADYFLNYYEFLAPGDIIIVVGSNGGTRTVDVLVVQTAGSGGVTVVNGT